MHTGMLTHMIYTSNARMHPCIESSFVALHYIDYRLHCLFLPCLVLRCLALLMRLYTCMHIYIYIYVYKDR